MSQLQRHRKDYQEHYRDIPVLVLGATGFVGRWVAHALSASGAQAHLTVRDQAGAQSIFTDFAVQGTVHVIDLRDLQSVHSLVREIRPTITFNLAGYGIDRAERNPDLAYQINVRLVEALCSAIAEIRNERWEGQDFVHVGSAAEYGQITGNLAENSITEPTTLYGRSKQKGTLVLRSACQTGELRGLTARLFALYGPGEMPARLLPLLLECARTQQPIELTAGQHERDFVYIEDVADGLLRLGMSAAMPGDIVNVATGKLSSIRAFIEEAATILGIPDELLLFGALPTRAEEMKHAPITNARLRTLTDWVPSTTLADGIRNSWVFAQSQSTRNYIGQ